MKRLPLKFAFQLSVVAVMGLFCASNVCAAGSAPVTVVNPASNPVRTTDAFPRIPFTLRLSVDDSETFPRNYTVPAGYRLVVETLAAFIQCQISPGPATGATSVLTVETIQGPHSVPIGPMTPGVLAADFQGMISLRIVVEPGRDIRIGQSTCFGSLQLVSFVDVFGYFVSVNSPSLAP